MALPMPGLPPVTIEAQDPIVFAPTIGGWSRIAEEIIAGSPAGRVRYARHMWRLDQPLEPDPVSDAYTRDVDRTLLRENLRRSLEERIEVRVRVQQLAGEFRRAGQRGTMTDFKTVVRVLVEGGVDFIVAGGLAGSCTERRG